MSFMSQYLDKKLLDHVFNKTAYTAPTIYAALCTTLPTSTDSGSTIVETTYTSYTRVLINSSDMNPAASVSGFGQITNLNAISFPTSTGGTTTIVAIALVDASSAGNLLYFGSLTQSLPVFNGSPVVIPVADLAITQT